MRHKQAFVALDKDDDGGKVGTDYLCKGSTPCAQAQHMISCNPFIRLVVGTKPTKVQEAMMTRRTLILVMIRRTLILVMTRRTLILVMTRRS